MEQTDIRTIKRPALRDLRPLAEREGILTEPYDELYDLSDEEEQSRAEGEEEAAEDYAMMGYELARRLERENQEGYRDFLRRLEAFFVRHTPPDTI